MIRQNNPRYGFFLSHDLLNLALDSIGHHKHMNKTTNDETQSGWGLGKYKSAKTDNL
jgi:hypothetical protein